MKFTLIFAFLALLGSFSTSAIAQNEINENTAPQPSSHQAPPLPIAGEPPHGKMGGKPPSDAIEICAGKAEQSICIRQGPQGEERGFCEYTPDNLYFACNPQRGPRLKPSSPPSKNQGS